MRIGYLGDVDGETKEGEGRDEGGRGRNSWCDSSALPRTQSQGRSTGQGTLSPFCLFTTLFPRPSQSVSLSFKRFCVFPHSSDLCRLQREWMTRTLSLCCSASVRATINSTFLHSVPNLQIFHYLHLIFSPIDTSLLLFPAPYCYMHLLIIQICRTNA